MKYFNVMLYDFQGCEICRCEAIEGMKRAKEQANHLLSDAFAENNETTHERFGTMKAAIFAEDAPTGANAVCEWDKEHPQHAEWVAAEDAKAAREETLAEQKREGW
jgi:hypothetical protein